MLGDAALREGVISPDLLVATADRHRTWAGSPAARAAAQFADGLSDSVGESRLRLLMANHGLWREDRLRALGFEVVRVGWLDLDHPYTTATRIGEAVVRAHRRRAPVGAGPALRGP